jgi:probable RNA-binding protein EIF1AD
LNQIVISIQGDFVIIEPIEEGDKVKAEIINILNKDHIRYIKSENLWPKEFETIKNNQNNDTNDDMFPPSQSESECEEESNEKSKKIEPNEDTTDSD